MARKASKSRNPLRLQGALDVQHAADLQATLIAQLGQAAEALTVDLAEVSSCDSAGLQLLCAARKSVLATGRQWQLTNPSESVLRTCAEVALNPQELGL